MNFDIMESSKQVVSASSGDVTLPLDYILNHKQKSRVTWNIRKRSVKGMEQKKEKLIATDGTRRYYRDPYLVWKVMGLRKACRAGGNPVYFQE